MKKNIVLFLFLNSFCFSQNSTIVKLKRTLKNDAVKTIILDDSILQNISLSNKKNAKVKYYQAIAYQNNKNHKKAICFKIKDNGKGFDKNIKKVNAFMPYIYLKNVYIYSKKMIKNHSQ